MGNFGLSASVPWLKDTEGALCFTYKEDNENTDCPQFEENICSIWCNLDLETMRSNLTDGTQIADLIEGLNHQHKVMLLVGGFPLPFDHETTTLINKRFISSAVGKIYKLRTKKLCELEPTWPTS